MKEKVEVQRQAEKENADLLKHVKLLETELEEQVNRAIELEQAHRLERGDLQQQVQALEKQLEKNRKFLDVSDEDYGLICCCCVAVGFFCTWPIKKNKKNTAILNSSYINNIYIYICFSPTDLDLKYE